MFTQEQIAELRTEWMRAEENARGLRDKYITSLRESVQSNQVDAEALHRVKSILSSLDISHESHQANPENFQDGISEQENGNSEMPGMSMQDGPTVA